MRVEPIVVEGELHGDLLGPDDLGHFKVFVLVSIGVLITLFFLGYLSSIEGLDCDFPLSWISSGAVVCRLDGVGGELYWSFEFKCKLKLVILIDSAAIFPCSFNPKSFMAIEQIFNRAISALTGR
jgi:hypothetical protein